MFAHVPWYNDVTNTLRYLLARSLSLSLVLGVKCEVEVKLCSSEPCYNGGTCQESLGVLHCQCPPGFSGGYCEVNIDECNSTLVHSSNMSNILFSLSNYGNNSLYQYLCLKFPKQEHHLLVKSPRKKHKIKKMFFYYNCHLNMALEALHSKSHFI